MFGVLSLALQGPDHVPGYWPYREEANCTFIYSFISSHHLPPSLLRVQLHFICNYLSFKEVLKLQRGGYNKTKKQVKQTNCDETRQNKRERFLLCFAQLGEAG